MKRVYEEYILIVVLLLFSNFLYSQIFEQRKFELLKNTNITHDGLNKKVSHLQNEILIRQIEGVKLYFGNIQDYFSPKLSILNPKK